MKATFQDNIGGFTVENVAQIVPMGNDLWDVMYTDYESEEVQGKLIEIIMEGF